MMHWNSLEEFFAMGGYGFYVWVSYALTVVCLAVELWQLRGRRQLHAGEAA